MITLKKAQAAILSQLCGTTPLDRTMLKMSEKQYLQGLYSRGLIRFGTGFAGRHSIYHTYITQQGVDALRAYNKELQA